MFIVDFKKLIGGNIIVYVLITRLVEYRVFIFV